MNLTAYEWGHKSPAELFVPETKAQHRERTGQPTRAVPRNLLPHDERRRRFQMLERVLPYFVSYSALARHLGCSSGCVSSWAGDRRPVPQWHTQQLESFLVEKEGQA